MTNLISIRKYALICKVRMEVYDIEALLSTSRARGFAPHVLCNFGVRVLRELITLCLGPCGSCITHW